MQAELCCCKDLDEVGCRSGFISDPMNVVTNVFNQRETSATPCIPLKFPKPSDLGYVSAFSPSLSLHENDVSLISSLEPFGYDELQSEDLSFSPVPLLSLQDASWTSPGYGELQPENLGYLSAAPLLNAHDSSLDPYGYNELHLEDLEYVSAASLPMHEQDSSSTLLAYGYGELQLEDLGYVSSALLSLQDSSSTSSFTSCGYGELQREVGYEQNLGASSTSSLATYDTIEMEEEQELQLENNPIYGLPLPMRDGVVEYPSVTEITTQVSETSPRIIETCVEHVEEVDKVFEVVQQNVRIPNGKLMQVTFNNERIIGVSRSGGALEMAVDEDMEGMNSPTDTVNIKISSGKHLCLECTREFSCSGMLTRHLKIHEGDYVCDRCNARFRNATSLTKHLRNEHKLEGAQAKKIAKATGPRS